MKCRIRARLKTLVQLAAAIVLCAALAACSTDDPASLIEGRTLMEPGIVCAAADGMTYTLEAVEWQDETHTAFALYFICVNSSNEDWRFQLESGSWFASGGGSGLSILQDEDVVAAGDTAEHTVQVSRIAAQQTEQDSYSWFLFEIEEVEYYLDLISFFEE